MLFPLERKLLLLWLKRQRRRNQRSRLRSRFEEKGTIMLWTIAVVLLVLWALGFVTSYTMGGFIHLLLLFALVAVAIRLIQGRRAIP
jgi:hypothetical protein